MKGSIETRREVVVEQDGHDYNAPCCEKIELYLLRRTVQVLL